MDLVAGIFAGGILCLTSVIVGAVLSRSRKEK